jgi:hypothetical protein
VTGHLMTGQLFRKALVRPIARQVIVAPRQDCKTQLQIPDRDSGVMVIGDAHGAVYGIQDSSTFWLFKHRGVALLDARPRQCRGVDRSNPRRGRVVGLPTRHAPLMRASLFMPKNRHASRTLPSDRSRANAPLRAGNARSVPRSCLAPATTSSNRSSNYPK